MKTIAIDIKKVDELIELTVEKDEKVPMDEVRVGMIKTLWQTMIKPMENNKGNGLAFIASYVKCKTAIDEAMKDDGLLAITLEDADFELLFKSFEGFNEWNLQFARVILMASECLKSANGVK